MQTNKHLIQLTQQLKAILISTHPWPQSRGKLFIWEDVIKEEKEKSHRLGQEALVAPCSPQLTEEFGGDQFLDIGVAQDSFFFFLRKFQLSYPHSQSSSEGRKEFLKWRMAKLLNGAAGGGI